MSTETVYVSESGDIHEGPPVTGTVVTAAEKPDPAVEREAREMGWVPEGEWKGDPPRGGFKTADEFVQRGKEVLPIVNKRLTEENAKLKDDLERTSREATEKIANLERMSKVALDRQRKQIEAEFETRKEAAVETGDKQAYRDADKAQKDALADFDKAVSKQDDEGNGKTEKFEVPPSVKQTVDAWVSQNDWFKTDEEMNAVANARHAKLLKEKPGLSLADNLAQVSEYVKKRFPEKFADDEPADDDPPRRGSPVESGSRMNGGGGKSAWSRIPRDAQAQADRFIKDDGLFLDKGESAEKDLQKARERYAREYLGEQ